MDEITKLWSNEQQYTEWVDDIIEKCRTSVEQDIKKWNLIIREVSADDTQFIKGASDVYK